MNDHNKNDVHKGMMWMMLICCALPLILLIFGGGAVFSGNYILVGLVGILIILHLWTRYQRHKTKDEKS